MEIPLGKQPKGLRCERGMTQKQTAGAPGLNSVAYLHYEKAQREPPRLCLRTLRSTTA